MIRILSDRKFGWTQRVRPEEGEKRPPWAPVLRVETRQSWLGSSKPGNLKCATKSLTLHSTYEWATSCYVITTVTVTVTALMQQTTMLSSPSGSYHSSSATAYSLTPLQGNYNSTFPHSNQSTFPLSDQSLDPNSPEIFKQNIQLIQQQVTRVNELARSALNGMWVNSRLLLVWTSIWLITIRTCLQRERISRRKHSFADRMYVVVNFFRSWCGIFGLYHM